MTDGTDLRTALGPEPIWIGFHPEELAEVLAQSDNFTVNGDIVSFRFREGEIRVHGYSDRTPQRIRDLVNGGGTSTDEIIWFSVEPEELASVLAVPENYVLEMSLRFAVGQVRLMSGRIVDGHNAPGVPQRIRRAIRAVL